MTIREATQWDWQAIDALRHAYFEKFGVPVQERGPDVVWRVAVNNKGAVCGVYSVATDVLIGQRWLYDFYLAASKAGMVAGEEMLREMRRQAEDDGVLLLAMIDPRNMSHLRRMLRRGWSLVGLTLSL